jgi:hypothetical protein
MDRKREHQCRIIYRTRNPEKTSSARPLLTRQRTSHAVSTHHRKSLKNGVKKDGERRRKLERRLILPQICISQHNLYINTYILFTTNILQTTIYKHRGYVSQSSFEASHPQRRLHARAHPGLGIRHVQSRTIACRKPADMGMPG